MVAANRRLAAVLSADARAVDAARILRPPETFDFKHGDRVPVVLERFAAPVAGLEPATPSLPCAYAQRRPHRRNRSTASFRSGRSPRAVPEWWVGLGTICSLYGHGCPY